MGIILRQSFTNTLYSYAGAVIGFINIIWLFPFVLEADQFGLTRVMISVGIIGAQVASLGMGNVTLRFFPQFRNREKGHFGFLFLALIVPLAGFILLSLAGWLFRRPFILFYSDDSTLFGEYFLLLFPLLFFLLYFHVLESYIRSLLDTVAATFLQDVLLRLLQTAVVLIYFFADIPFGLFMLLYTGSFGIQTLLLLIYIGFKKELFLRPDVSNLTPQRMRSMTDYALFAIIGSVTTIALGNIDMLMVGGMIGLAETAVYAVSFYLGSIIKIPSKALLKISQPLIAEAHHRDDLDSIAVIYTKSSINQMLVGGLLFIGIWANIAHIYRFLPELYHGGMSVFLLIGFAKWINMAAGLNTAIIRTSKWYRFDLYATLLLLVLTIGTNLLFIPLFGITGAALATAISILIHNLVCVVYVYHRFGIQPFTRKTGTGIILLGVTLLAGLYLPSLPVWMADLLLRSALITIMATAGLFLFRLSDDLQDMILNAWRIFVRKPK